MDNNNMNIIQKNNLQLLGIQDVTTKRQKANGTLVFKLPVRDQYGAAIHVASYKSGYVRRVKAGGYCDCWQLNKTKKVKSEYGWDMIERILIPNEVERLDYLIAFCLKNYYIGQANMLSSGNFIPKWKHEYKVNEALLENTTPEVKVIVNGHRYNVI